MSFYEAGFETLFRNALNGMNTFPFELTEQMYRLENPRPIAPGREGYRLVTNTVCDVVGTGVANHIGESYVGKAEVLYTRLDLGLLFKGISLEWSTQNKNSQDFANWVANNLNIPMVPEDLKYEEFPVTANNSYVEIHAAPDSKWFIGSCMAYYTLGKPDISTLIPPNWESGIYKKLDPLDANYVLTYNHDYTGNGALLRQTAAKPSDANSGRIWSILMGNGEAGWNRNTRCVLIDGEANVVAAGGRKGFKALFQIPSLNIWAHFND